MPRLRFLIDHHSTWHPQKKFTGRWQSSGGHERSSGQLFLIELCDLLGPPHRDAPKPETVLNDFVFECAVTRIKPDGTQTTVFIDLYQATRIVFETKQG